MGYRARKKVPQREFPLRKSTSFFLIIIYKFGQYLKIKLLVGFRVI